MSPLQSLRNRARMLATGLISFLALLAAFRWSSGEPLVQPSGDVGIVIGVVLIALYFVITDTKAGQAAPKSPSGSSLRRPESH